MKQKMFFIGNNVASIEPGDLKPGIRIICITYSDYWVTFKDFEGPYNTLKELTKKSILYKELQKIAPARAQQIIDKKHIIYCHLDNCIFTLANQKKTNNYLRTIQHIIKGNIKKNQLKGIHFFDKEKMKIIQETKKEDKNGVWEAKIIFFDKSKKNWFEKQSTFFPKKWNHTQLWHECNHAIDYMKPHKNSQNKFYSTTFTGVPVEIVIKEGLLVTIYPLYTE